MQLRLRSQVLLQMLIPQTYSISMVNHNTILRLREYARESNGSISNKIISTKELDINDFVTVTDPNPAEKSGYQSSLSEKDLANNSTLKKYADLIDYNELTTNLIAKKQYANLH